METRIDKTTSCLRCDKESDGTFIVYTISHPVIRKAYFCQECWFRGTVHSIMSAPLPPDQQLDE